MGSRTARGGRSLDSVLDLLDRDRSERDLREYFGTGGTRGKAGAAFETLMGGGDRPEVRDLVTADDLIAAQTLSIRVPSRVAVNLLEGDLGPKIAALLRAIPVDLGLHDEQARQYVEDGSSADQAWRLMTDQRGVDFVIAGKILARKRPHLIPVYDNVVRCVVQAPDGFWLWLHSLLQAEGGLLAERVRDLHRRAGIPDEVGLLRTFDVAIWMRHHRDHRNGRCHPSTI